MVNRKILLSLCLIFLVAISVSAISAADSTDVVVADESQDIVAVDDSDDVLSADPITPRNNSVAAVQEAVDAATNDGDVVDLSVNTEYDFEGSTVTIANSNIVIDGKGITTIKGYGNGNGLFAITGKNVIVQGIKFNDTNPNNDFVYGGNVAGWGISANGANGGAVKNCEFADFNSGIVVMGTSGFTIENNNFTGGYSTLIANDPTVNVETGSKSLNIYRQSNQITVRGNRFEGPILDGVSIAQGSGSNIVENNVFVGNTYGIYFGGSSTKNSVIRGNTFINCGEFKRDGQNWIGLPVISIQKASNDIAIVDNTFQAINDNILIAAEQGNEAHGFPSSLGNINVTGNTVVKYNDSVDTSNVTLFHILIRESGTLSIFAPINVTNNDLVDGVTGISVWLLDGNVEIFTAKEAVLDSSVSPIHYLFNTTLTTSDITLTAGDSGNIVFTLKDNNGNVLVNKELVVSINGESKTYITDFTGAVTVPVQFTNANTYYATATFLGEGNNYKASVASAKITVNAKPTPAVVKKATKLTAKKATLKVKKVKKVKATLKSSGKAVAGKKITVKVNKKTFKAKTNKKGVATIKVKVTKKGKFTAVFKFAGDKDYKASSKKVKFTVKK